jgi:hypothetical protein
MVYQDPAQGSRSDGSTTDVAKDQAGRVGSKATEAGGQVAQVTKEQAQQIVGEAKQQARDLFGEARTQVRDQAGTQRDRAVQGLRTVSDELDQMALQGGQSGLATEVARQLSGRTRELASQLERHEPSDLLEQVRAYARRRPVVFLAGAALAGVVAGRLTKSLAAGAPDTASRQLGSGERYLAAEPAVGAGAYTSPDYYPSAGYQADTGYDAGYERAGYPTPAGGPTTTVGAGYDEEYAPAGGYPTPAGGPTTTAGSPTGTGYETARPADYGDGFREPDAGPERAYGSETVIPPASGGPGYPSPSVAPYEPEQPPARGWTP